MCIQGFVIAAIATVLVGAPLAGLAVLTLLDVTAPALLFGMTIGRVGCLLGGCCVGRPTASRWGMWSSDRRLGMRRIPIQLLESSTALALGVVAAAVVWTGASQPAGATFVGSMAAYTLARQLLFPLRAGARRTTHGRVITLVVSALVFTAAVAAVIAAGPQV
ncbi:prolipoprotein diacylglyceryl transferase family protein [Euzebya pacifica]|jgi:phosphatidylglycerol:prolipoprotein diacylglycerol transferase|uniref:prolipoprotein diacylglyceryl transferase family protein n=1 Tax=Euzebya pacifica TaxID=1608957 RepID=UPI0030FC7A41